MQAFPPESRPHLAHHFRTVVKSNYGSTHNKTNSTEESRQDNWLQYCRRSRLSDPTLKDVNPKAVNLLFASWAADLFSGQNCNKLAIKSTTVQGYLKAAQKLLIQGGYSHHDGLPLDKSNNSESEIFIAKVRKFEKLPQRRSMIDDNMLEEFHKRKLSSQPDSLYDCFFDWLSLGRYTGFRLSEWAQTRKYSYERVTNTNDSRAMINSDWLFYDQNGHIIDKTNSNSSRVFRVDICWRFQKNKQNGEVISFWRDNVEPRFCPVRAAWRISLRALRLGIPAQQPIGQFFDHTRRCMAFMNAPECESYMRAVARLTTGITDDTTINALFGMHSIRVTACNELARLGVTDSFIQRRLRWRSMTFLDYLRNNMFTARRHNLSLNIKYSAHDTAFNENMLHTRTQRHR